MRLPAPSANDGGCGCSLLRRRSSWKGPYWALTIPARQLISGALSGLFAATDRLVSFEAKSLGPSHLPRRSEKTSRAALLSAIAGGKLRPEVRYELVTAA